MLDANEAHEDPEQGLSKFLNQTGLVDVHRYFHGSANEPATYNRGSKKIDHILCTQGLLDCVQGCGIEAFGEGLDSDHRGLFLDIDADKLFGESTPDLTHASARILDSHIPFYVRKYRRELHRQFAEHNVYDRVLQLSRWLGPTGRAHINAYEAVDWDITTACLAAEKVLGNPRVLPWSPELLTRLGTMYYWKKLQALRATKKKIPKKLRDVASTLGRPIDSDFQLSLAHIKRRWRYAKLRLKEYRKNAASFCDNWLREQAEAAAAAGKGDVAGILKSIRQHEKTRNLFRKLRAALNPKEFGGLMSVWIPAEAADGSAPSPEIATDWEVVNDPVAVERHIIEQSKRHFRQAQGTPFTISPLTQLDSTEHPKVREIMQSGLPKEWSKVTPVGWNEETAHFIDRLQADDKIPTIDTVISMEEFKRGIKRWKERTTTSPSGRHLGHLHVLLAPDGVMNPDEHGDSTTDIANKILTVHLRMMNIAIAWGYPPLRWRNVTMFVLEKEAGKPKIHRLRNIHLYEADYNFMLKLLWSKRLVRHAEHHKLLHDSQWGSRPKRRASDAVLQKQLQYELTYGLRKQLVSMELDARACYDRIISTCAMLLSMMHGMPASACQLQRRMLDEAHFRIRTSLGLSSDGFHHSQDDPVYGNGQGSGSSPPVWLMISSVLLEEMETSDFKLKFSDPARQLEHDGLMVVYVDDSGTMINDFPVGKGVQAITTVAQKWERLLFSTGGALAPGKCFFYVVKWEWDAHGKAVMRKTHALDDPLLLYAGHDFIPQQVPRKEVSAGHRTLGVRLDPNITFKDEVVYLKQVSNKIAGRLRRTNLSKSEVRTAFRTMYLPKLCYSASVASLSPAQCWEVESTAIRAFLSALGYNPNMPRPLVFAPDDLGGVGLNSINTEQGVEHVQALVRHVRDDKTVGPLMKILLRTSQLISGFTKDILLYPHLDLRFMAEFKQKWICKIRSILASAGAQIYLSDHWTPSLSRDHDLLLMETFSGLGFSTWELERLNRCRIFLQVNTLSKICNAAGDRIVPECYSQPTKNFRISKLAWPVQEAPGSAEWRLWRRALDHLIRGHDFFLRQPLGSWQKSVSTLDQCWDWYWDHAQNALHRDGRMYPALESGRVTRRPKFSLVGVDASMESHNCFPVDVRTTTEFFTMDSTVNFVVPSDLVVGNWSDGLLTSVQLHIPAYLLRSKLVLGVDIWLVSDASKKHGKGAYAWIIASKTDTLCTNTGLVFAAVNSMTSYRAEAFGVLSLVVFLRRLFATEDCSFHTTLKIFCDNISVVNSAGSTSETKADTDVFLQLRHELECMSKFLSIQFTHVKGHDRLTPFSSRETVLNHWCDREAKAMVAATEVGICQRHFHFPSAKIALVKDGTVGRSIPAFLRSAVARADLIRYWQEKYAWDKATARLIDWSCYEAAHWRLPYNQKTILVKYRSRWLATRARLHLLNASPNTECPLCGQPDETITHILVCPKQAPKRQKLYRQLSEWFQHFNIPVKLHHILVSQIKHFLKDGDSPGTVGSNASSALQQFVEEQETIGWGNLFCGFVSLRLATYMDNHLRDQDNCDGPEWVIRLLRLLQSWVAECWHARCQQEHQKNKEHASATRLNLLSRIEHVYEVQHKVPVSFWHCFKYPLKYFHDKSDNFLENWLILYEKLILDSAQDPQRQQNITEFFSFLSTD